MMLVSPSIDLALAALFGMLVGSFLNVVIHRLPRMLERQWASECAELGGQPAPGSDKFNLMWPRSRCPHCDHQISWHENIPVLSYLLLRARCASCGAKISARYPLVELVCGALFFFSVWKWGASPAALAWSGFGAALLTLALIDWDTTILPDDITLPLLWAGLLASALHLTNTPLPSAFWGAVGGYLSLWTIYWGFKLLTGKEGMGYGDFKLFAALGAWFGWQALIPMILMASVIGAIVGISMKFAGALRDGGYVPFGPFLAGAGITAMVFGPHRILRLLGL